MQADEMLRMRSAARDEQRSRDEEVYRMHENAVAALSDPAIAEDVRVEALLTTREWEDTGLFSQEHIERWRTILAMEDDEAKRAILAESEEAAELRRNTPFSDLALKYPHG